MSLPSITEPERLISTHQSTDDHTNRGSYLRSKAIKFRPNTSCLAEVDVDTAQSSLDSSKRCPRHVRFRSRSDVFEAPDYDAPSLLDVDDLANSGKAAPHYTISLKECIEGSPKTRPSMPRLFAWTIFVAIVLTLVHNSPLIGTTGNPKFGVNAGLIRPFVEESQITETRLSKRQSNDPTDFCTRWSHQSAMVNGTIYIYGGRSKTDPNQQSNTWNNDFLTLDATKTFQISSPTFKGLDRPSGPPAVANGYLWHSFTKLFLYGGEYSDNPTATPSAYSMWEYDIPSSEWTEHSAPRTLPGNNSDGGNNAVERSGEGAGVSVPTLGRGYYFGGHLDAFTTEGWSVQTERVYLKSLLEYTFPGYPNDGIEVLSNDQPAGNDGAWRNITEGGLQDSRGFTERADGVLVYVPGFGEQGIILGLAGGTNTTFTEMNVIDVYDIANSTWYKQATSGETPDIRVNPCAVAASAADGSSTNVYLYGGQNLIPAGSQTQYDDMWILTVPSFTWVKVDTNGQSVPPARAGHSCEIWNGQMIVIGGYVGTDISCDSPGIYIFDLSELKWRSQFTALSGGDDLGQQASQTEDTQGLAGSYGYQVPDSVQSVVGGSESGGATITAPAVAATAGPIATGGPIVYTITANGATVTETAGASGSSGGQASGGPNIAAIVAGVVAGVFFVIACYLGFCTWVYRRQLQLYKNHVAAAQRAAAAPPNEKPAFLASGGRSSEDPSSRDNRSTAVSSSGPSGNSREHYAPGGVPRVPGQPIRRDSTANSSTEDLLTEQEPSFIGVLLSPRRSLRVINH